jgi:hypothetical protein
VTTDYSKIELAQEAFWRKCAADPVYFFEHYWKIQHPEKGAILFELFDAQKRAMATFMDERYVVTLKARQIGWTTLVAAYAFWLAYFHPDRLIIFLSKGEREASAILQKVQFGFTRLPDWMKVRGPRTLRDNMSQIEFANGSSIESLPSKSDPARGRSCYLVVVDEWAFLENPDEAWASIEPIADVGGRVIGLSTANGWGNFFHKLYTDSVGGKNQFAHIFEPWDARDDRDADWYNAKVASLPEWQLHQEYPRNAAEAFLKSGNPFFDVEQLAKLPTREPQRGFLQSVDFVTFIEQDGGLLSLYEYPIPENTYVIGADTAEGLEHGDYCSAHVIHWRTHEVVAHWHGHIPPAEFAEVLADLGRFYNLALIGPENNHHGLTVCQYLKDKYRYPNLFYTKVTDEKTRRSTNKMGWSTTKKSRPEMLDGLDEALREQSLVLWDAPTIGELMGFVRTNAGRWEGSPFDDRVISLAIAVQMLKYAVQWQHQRGVVDWGTLEWWEQTLTPPQAVGAIGSHNVRRDS